ncbi:MAG: acyltransferase family protein [Candidatus Bathyarchaeota archaeon]|nr:acyltransferase family protein [Candidatus Termiticorpusculum sp.]
MDQQKDTLAIPVDLIRVIAIVGVILLHASNDLTSQHMGFDLLRWWTLDIYQGFGRMGVPLFLMLSGALLLAPSKKDEEIGVFFKKRFSRIGLPFLFWSIIFFFWVFYVENHPLTQDFIINGILNGPYFILWYLYMLAGLYLLTPLLRVIVANFTAKHFKYFICLWAIGTTLGPIITWASIGQYQLDPNFFLIPVFLGYFVIGAYLVNVKVKRLTLVTLTALGLALTAITTCLMIMYHSDTYFFHNYYSPTTILASIPFFILLNSYGKPPNDSKINKPSWKQRLMHVISENTLPLYLMHMIFIYLFQTGFFGFSLHGNIVNSIVGVPLMTVLTIGACLLIIIPLKKIPGLKHLIG